MLPPGLWHRPGLGAEHPMAHATDDERDQTWNARQKELMKGWRHNAESVVGILRDILAMTRVAGNGGYIADIGPVTYGRMVRLVGLKCENCGKTMLDHGPLANCAPLLNDGSESVSDA